jgi:hypothetical protein
MKKKNVVIPAVILWLGILSCRPVIAIGWGEFLILAVLIVVLIGPPAYRFIRGLENSRRQKDK